MAAAILNVCTAEELNESADDPLPSVEQVDRDERRKMIMKKIMAVNRLSHRFSLLRCATVAPRILIASPGGSTDMTPSCVIGFALPPFVE